jgi:hypothetical protein
MFAWPRAIRVRVAAQIERAEKPMANFNNQAKRKRELAKQDKRAAKDRKRAQRKAEARGATGAVAASPTTSTYTKPAAPSLSKEAAEWMKPKVPAVKGRPTAASASTFIRPTNVSGK